MPERAILSSCSSALLSAGFERLRLSYQLLLTDASSTAGCFRPGFSRPLRLRISAVPWLGQDFFPSSDNGQFRLHFRDEDGTRIEETARLCDLIDQVDSPADPSERTGQHRRQHRDAAQRHQHDIRQQRAGRLRGRRTFWFRSRRATGRRRSGSQTLRPKTAHANFPDHVLFPAGRHDDPDSELRSAGADRCAGGRAQISRQIASSRISSWRNIRRFRAWWICGFSSHSTSPNLAHYGGSNQSAAGGITEQGRREQPAGIAERQRPDHADILPEPKERRAITAW